MLTVSKNEIQHISIAELDAVLKGVNVVLQWNPTELHLLMDSAYVHGWISDTLSGKARIKTKASSNMQHWSNITRTDQNTTEMA